MNIQFVGNTFIDGVLTRDLVMRRALLQTVAGLQIDLPAPVSYTISLITWLALTRVTPYRSVKMMIPLAAIRVI